MRQRQLLVVVAMLALVGAGCAKKTTTNTNASTNTTVTNTSTNTGSTTGTFTTNSATTTNSGTTNTNTVIVPTTASVTIDNFAFSPDSLTVKKGTTVTWTNRDSATHKLRSSNGPASEDLGTSETYSFTFTTVGTFAYSCGIHASMQGTVIVTD